MDFEPGFLKETLESWRPYYREELTPEDAREIASNMIEFFNALAEWKGETYNSLPL